MTHTELVLEVLRANRSDVVSTGDIVKATGLTRAQVTRVLGKLDSTLGDKLEQITSGLWRYEPIRTDAGFPNAPDAARATYDSPYQDEWELDVPIGWQTKVVVVAKHFLPGDAIEFTLQTESGLLLTARPVMRMEALRMDAWQHTDV